MNTSLTERPKKMPPRAVENLFWLFAGFARVGINTLGLFIAREVMRTHGGDIELIRISADGTVFSLTLPGAEVLISEMAE